MSDTDQMPPPESAPMSKEDKASIERQEEQKLRNKYPQMSRPFPGGAPGVGPGGVASGAGGGGHSAFLQKRLAKGQKYFDSGDYQMAKQKPRGLPGSVLAGGPGGPGVGGALGGGAPGGPGRLTMPVLAPPTGETIPTPELVPARKTSIIQPLHDHTQSMHLPSDPAHAGAGAAGSSSEAAGGKPLVNPALAKLAS